MRMTNLRPFLYLIALGAGWGLTLPLAKMAVNGGLQPFGLLFWQSILGIAVLLVVLLVQGKRLPITRSAVKYYFAIAWIGTIIPGSVSFQAYKFIPSGIMSLLLSLVPIFAFPIALALGNDKFQWRRFVGLLIGFCGAVVILGVPNSVPAGVTVGILLFGMIPALCYGFEGNFIAKWGTGGADPIQLLAGASGVAAVITLPLALGTGQMFNPLALSPDLTVAVVASSVIHAFVYSFYVMMVRGFGPVFSVQVSYLVTLFGMFWAMALLGDRYSSAVAIALGLIFAGIYLVSPKSKSKSKS